MGKYDLDRLGNIEFENLVQSLTTKIFNNQNIIFGAGRDGAREATFNGKSRLGNEDYEGYHVVQAKFKDSIESKDWEWAKLQFKKEMDKFKDKKRDLLTPKVYLFFTNIQFTAVSKLGGRDKIQEFIKEYNDLIPNIIIYGCDEIYGLLDNHRDVATTYASFILSGDILQELYTHMNISKSRDNDILYRFLNKEFDENLYSKLEQAGKVTDEQVNLDKVFVDLNISGNHEEEDRKFVDFCLNKGNRAWKNEQFKMVFIGGPGQGKSTVTQFLTQIYRIYFLQTFQTKTLSDNVKNFKRQIGNKWEPQCYRFPINIILSDYSEWLSREKKGRKSFSVLSYIQHRIEHRADEQFSKFNNFRELLNKLSFIFIFDGLDEVPITSNRNDVIKEIDSFINYELKTVNCDAIIIATTRPQGYSDEFSREKKFEHFKLDDLDKETCLRYLRGLIHNTVHSTDEKIKQTKILEETLENEITAEIMTTPLQATIMAILVKSGGKPAKDKFSLFDDYYETMLRREKQKNVLKIIGEHEKYINEIHYTLGNRLQVSSQKGNNTSAYLDINDFKTLVENYFDRQGLLVEEKNRYTKEIMEAITERLVFITENQDGKIGFAIRSTQEYFSAMKNVHNIREKEVIANTKKISESAYWRNVFIFMVGYMVINKDYIIDDNLDSYVGELNGSNLRGDQLSLSKVSNYGSLLSLEILSESIFTNHPKLENKFIKHLKGLTNTLVSNSDNYQRLLQKLKSNIFYNGFNQILIDGVNSKELYRRMSSWNIISIVSVDNHDFLKQFYMYWMNDEKEELYYLNLFIENNIYSEFVLKKYCQYLNWNYYDNLVSLSNSLELIDTLLDLKDASFDKNFLIEFLFLNSESSNVYRANNHLDRDKLLFKLLEIETVDNLISLRGETKVIKEITSTNISFIKMKDMGNNKLLNDLCTSTSKSKDLSLLFSFFNYLLNPSEKTLKICFSEIKLKKDKLGISINYHLFNFNWQLKYIIKEMRYKSSIEKVYKSIEKFGKNYEDYVLFEENISDDGNIFQNIEYLTIEGMPNSDSRLAIFDFYEEVYIKNRTKTVEDFLIFFVNNVKTCDVNHDIEKFNKIMNEVIEENKTTTYPIVKNLVFLRTISHLDESELLKWKDIEYKSILDKVFIPYLLSDILSSIVEKLISVISFTKKENNFIGVLFSILIHDGHNTSSHVNLNILLELTYKNKELQMFGYLASLIDKRIHQDENKVNRIKDFLLSYFKETKNSKILEYTLNIIERNHIKSDFVINSLFFEIYKVIDKENVDSCLIRARYEKYFKSLFENKVIEFDNMPHF